MVCLDVMEMASGYIRGTIEPCALRVGVETGCLLVFLVRVSIRLMMGSEGSHAGWEQAFIFSSLLGYILS